MPEGIKAAVAEMTDAAKLSRWLKRAAKAKSLEAFRAAVRLSTANGSQA